MLKKYSKEHAVLNFRLFFTFIAFTMMTSFILNSGNVNATGLASEHIVRAVSDKENYVDNGESNNAESAMNETTDATETSVIEKKKVAAQVVAVADKTTTQKKSKNTTSFTRTTVTINKPVNEAANVDKNAKPQNKSEEQAKPLMFDVIFSDQTNQSQELVVKPGQVILFQVKEGAKLSLLSELADPCSKAMNGRVLDAKTEEEEENANSKSNSTNGDEVVSPKLDKSGKSQPQATSKYTVAPFLKKSNVSKVNETATESEKVEEPKVEVQKFMRSGKSRRRKRSKNKHFHGRKHYFKNKDFVEGGEGHAHHYVRRRLLSVKGENEAVVKSNSSTSVNNSNHGHKHKKPHKHGENHKIKPKKSQKPLIDASKLVAGELTKYNETVQALLTPNTSGKVVQKIFIGHGNCGSKQDQVNKKILSIVDYSKTTVVKTTPEPVNTTTRSKNKNEKPKTVNKKLQDGNFADGMGDFRSKKGSSTRCASLSFLQYFILMFAGIVTMKLGF